MVSLDLKEWLRAPSRMKQIAHSVPTEGALFAVNLSIHHWPYEKLNYLELELDKDYF